MGRDWGGFCSLIAFRDLARGPFDEEEEDELELVPRRALGLTSAVCSHCTQPISASEMEAKPPTVTRPVPKVVKKVVKENVVRI